MVRIISVRFCERGITSQPRDSKSCFTNGPLAPFRIDDNFSGLARVVSQILSRQGIHLVCRVSKTVPGDSSGLSHAENFL